MNRLVLFLCPFRAIFCAISNLVKWEWMYGGETHTWIITANIICVLPIRLNLLRNGKLSGVIHVCYILQCGGVRKENVSDVVVVENCVNNEGKAAILESEQDTHSSIMVGDGEATKKSVAGF